jgi:hypothetical protein
MSFTDIFKNEILQFYKSKILKKTLVKIVDVGAKLYMQIFPQVSPNDSI